MTLNEPIKSWIPPQIDELSSQKTRQYQDVILSNQHKEEGFNKGYQEGLMKAEKEKQSQLDQAKQIIYELSKIKGELIQDAEYVLSDIAMMMAKKLITHELSINKTQIENVLREMLAKIPDMNESIKIKVNRDDLEIIKNVMTNETNKEVDITVDTSLSVGSIRLKSNFTKLEYNIDSIFESMVKKVSQ